MNRHPHRSTTAQTVTVWLLALVALLALLPARAEPARPGKTLISRHDLPDDIVRKLAGVQAGPVKAAPGESLLVSVQMADAVEWTGPEIDAVPSNNPYLIVVTVKGRVRTDGDVTTLWKSGWNLGDALRSTALPGLSRSQMKAGEDFEARAVSQPMSFKVARRIAPVVGMVSASNLEIRSVQVELWSGLTGPGWRDLLFSLQGALVGVVMIGLVWWWRR